MNKRILLTVPAILSGPAMVLVTIPIVNWSAAGGSCMALFFSLIMLKNVWSPVAETQPADAQSVNKMAMLYEELKSFVQRDANRALGIALSIALIIAAFVFYDDYTPVLPTLFTSLFQLFAVYIVYECTKRIVESSPTMSSLLFLKGVIFCIVLSFIVASQVGTHIEDADPLFGGGERVVDFVATEYERKLAFWRMLILSGVAVAAGLYKGLTERSHKQLIERLKAKQQPKPQEPETEDLFK